MSGTASKELEGNAPFIVVGGGLGGLATALALGRQGYTVTPLEQAQEIAPLGYGVQLGPNVLPILGRLGLAKDVLEAAYLPQDLLLLDAANGERLFDIPLQGDAFDANFASPYIAIHRGDLHDILLRACRQIPRISLYQNATATGFVEKAHGVQTHTADGRTFNACALVAADGLRSRLRTQLHPSDIWRNTGYVAYRSLVPRDAAPQSMRQRKGVTMLTGDGFHVIYYPLRNQTEINIVGVFRAPPTKDPVEADGRSSIAHLVRDATDEVHDVISVLDLSRSWSIADREPVRRWHHGRVTLLGDAAHATLQSLAQGAGMALEDAVTLGALIARHGTDVERALSEFERQRFLRTTRVVLESRSLWQMYHCAGLEAEVRNQQWRERTSDDYYRCLSWLWKPLEEEQ